MKYRILITVLIITIFVSPAMSTPLDLPVGGRSQRLGGAYTAAADNSLAIYWNPSGLPNMETGEASISHVIMPEIEGLLIDFVGFGYPMKTGAIGIGWLRKGATLEQGIDNIENSFSENTFMLGYGLNIFSTFNIGVSMKRYLIDAGEAGAGAGLGFDLSGIYSISGYSVALVAKNMAASIKNEDIDPIFRLGNAYKYPFSSGYAMAVFDLWTKNNINSSEGLNVGFGAGAEVGYYLPKDWTFYLSGGYSRTYGVGVGILFKQYKLDYAMTGDPGNIGIGSSHIISFSFLFSEPKRPEARSSSPDVIGVEPIPESESTPEQDVEIQE